MKCLPLVLVFLAAIAMSPVREDWSLGLRGAGPIRFGMHIEEAARLANDDEIDLPRTWDCDDWMPDVASRGVKGVPVFSVRDQIIVGGTLVFPDGKTLSGARVGMLEDEVRRIYPGRLAMGQRPDAHPAFRWLIYEPRSEADSKYRLVFETDGVRVTSIVAGFWPLDWRFCE